MRYLAPANKLIDPASGYPFEGWNHDPEQGLFLRSFTQLTAIGQHMELLANIVAGHADSPELSREQALEGLTRLVTTPAAGPEGPEPRRQGAARQLPRPRHRQAARPLTADVEKQHDPGGVRRREGRGDLEGACGTRGGSSRATTTPRPPSSAGPSYGFDHFDGALAPYSDDATRQKLMAILDRRVVMVVFGDNANLSASVAKTIGALLAPEVAGPARGRRAPAASSRRSWRTRRRATPGSTTPRPACSTSAGTRPRTACSAGSTCRGTGRRATWTTSSTSSAARRLRLPPATGSPPTRSATWASRSSPTGCGTAGTVYALAPWDGSAFQALGLNLMLRELD